MFESDLNLATPGLNTGPISSHDRSIAGGQGHRNNVTYGQTGRLTYFLLELGPRSKRLKTFKWESTLP